MDRKIDGWLEGYKKQMDGWMDTKMKDWMDRTNGWLDG